MVTHPTLSMVLSTLSLLVLLLLLPIVSQSEACRVTENNIHCECLSSAYQSLGQSLRQVRVPEQLESSSQRNHSKFATFNTLLLENCHIHTLAPDLLNLTYHFRSLHMRNVAIISVERNAFDSVPFVRRLAHRNKERGFMCPRLSGSNLVPSLQALTALNFIELCANNVNDSVPSGAFRHRYLKTIRLNGNFSSYEIETNAFDELPQAKLIVFNQIDIRKVHPDAFRLISKGESSKDNMTIIFNRCKFLNLAENFDTAFASKSSRPIDLIISPKHMIPIESIVTFEPFLAIPHNRLFITNVICTRSQLEELNSKHSRQIQIKCSNVTDLWNQESSNPTTAEIIPTNQTNLDEVYQELQTNQSVSKEWYRDFDSVVKHFPFSENTDSANSQSKLLKMVDQIALTLDLKFQESLKGETVQTNVKPFDRLQEETRYQDDTVQLMKLDDDEEEEEDEEERLMLITTWIKHQPDPTILLNESRPLLNSNIINANLVEVGTRRLVELATIRIKFQNVLARKWSDTVNCVYWNFTSSHWSTTGCHFLADQSDSLVSVCQCDHLTNFAALLDISGRESNHQFKSHLTLVCCGLSALCLLTSIGLTQLVDHERYTLHNDQFRWKANRGMISFNIAICLLVTNLLTIFGMDRKEIQEICLSVSLTLLFFLLASFCFMLLQGYHLFKSTISPLMRDFRYPIYYAFGYGTPAVIIAISLLATWYQNHLLVDVFIGDYFCWMSAKHNPYFILIIIVPVTSTIILNVVFFILIVLSVLRRNRFVSVLNARRDSFRNRPLKTDTCRQSYSLALLLVNLGLTWILFLFYIADHTHYLAYLFIVFNGSQGVFFLINHILVLRSKGLLSFKKSSFTRTRRPTLSSSAGPGNSSSTSSSSNAWFATGPVIKPVHLEHYHQNSIE